MSENETSCVEPAAGPIGQGEVGGVQEKASGKEKEVEKMSVQVGKAAPDFEATAFHEGGFKKVKLSDFNGQWVVLCFYPGDFTFV